MKLGNVGRTIRVGVIGLGNRSREQIRCLVSMADVEIVVVCDVYADRVEAARNSIEQQCGMRPEGALDYREVNARDYQDMTREVDPLRQAEDAVVVDSSDMTFEETVQAVIDIVEARNV